MRYLNLELTAERVPRNGPGNLAGYEVKQGASRQLRLRLLRGVRGVLQLRTQI